jgi:hypothetical protein
MADQPEMSDEQATQILTSELVGRAVLHIGVRRDGSELFIEFDDHSRLFVNAEGRLDLSLTEGWTDDSLPQ